MATKKPVEKDPEVSIEQALTNTELFFERNGRLLLAVVALIILGVGGYFGYRYFYAAPRAEKAATAMFDAQHQFERDSFANALAGVKNVFLGFDEIIAEYDGTPEANLANHYAGICCMSTGDFARAITYFEKYKKVDNAAGQILYAQNVGLIGDCHIESGNTAEGIEFYQKAIGESTSEATAPLFMYKAAIAMCSEGQYADAAAMFRRLQGEFPRSSQARDADKYIAYAEQKQ